MIVSTKGRYALRVLIDIAEHQQGDTYIPLKDIAERQGLSQKYIEMIMTLISKGGFVDAAHGKHGGYRLNRKPEEYKVGEILRHTEGSLAPVTCLEISEEANVCPRKDNCRTLPMWTELNNLVSNFFDNYTLDKLMKKDNKPE